MLPQSRCGNFRLVVEPRKSVSERAKVEEEDARGERSNKRARPSRKYQRMLLVWSEGRIPHSPLYGLFKINAMMILWVSEGWKQSRNLVPAGETSCVTLGLMHRRSCATKCFRYHWDMAQWRSCVGREYADEYARRRINATGKN